MANSRLRTDARIVWAIAQKDIAETLRNKNVLALIVTTVLVTLLYRYLPVLRSDQELPFVAIYDAGDSALVPMLENSAVIEVRTYQSETDMLERVASGDMPELGLVVPDGFDAALDAGSAPALTGHALHWVSDDDLIELVTLGYQVGSRENRQRCGDGCDGG